MCTHVHTHTCTHTHTHPPTHTHTHTHTHTCTHTQITNLTWIATENATYWQPSIKQLLIQHWFCCCCRIIFQTMPNFASKALIDLAVTSFAWCWQCVCSLWCSTASTWYIKMPGWSGERIFFSVVKFLCWLLALYLFHTLWYNNSM